MTATAGRQRRIRRSRSSTRSPLRARALRYALLVVAAGFVLLPIVWMLSTAFKNGNDAFAIPPHWFSRPTTENFQGQIDGPFRAYLKHSAIVAAATTLIALGLGVPAGYAFSRATIPGGRTINTWFILAYVMPPIAFIIPIYTIYLHVHLLDTYTGLVIAYETGLLPFTIWLMRAYMSDIPRELDEAAWMDGCSRMGALWRVVLPTVWPGVVTVGLLVALSSWGEYFAAVILTGSRTETATVGLSGNIGLLGSSWGGLAAGGLILTIPTLIATLFVQSGFARGLSVGAVK